MGSWYFASSGTFGFHDNLRSKASINGLNRDQRIKFKTGFGGRAALGYALNAWRMELEANVNNNDIKRIRTIDQAGNTDVTQNVGGHLRNHAAMANLFYDLDLSQDFDLYVGGGLGGSYQFIKINRILIPSLNPVKYEYWVLAFQAMAGFTYHFDENWAINLGYRFFGTLDHNSQKQGQKIRLKQIPLSHNVEAGLRFTF